VRLEGKEEKTWRIITVWRKWKNIQWHAELLTQHL